MYEHSLLTYMNSVFWRIGVPPPFHLVKTKHNNCVFQLLWISQTRKFKLKVFLEQHTRAIQLNYLPSLNIFLDSLWFDQILLSILQEIIDVVVVDFYIRNKDAVAAVLVHTLCFISLLHLNHVRKIRIKLLPETKTLTLLTE